MSLSAGSIMGTLGLDTSGFTQGFLQAQTLTSTFPSIITSFMANPLLGLVNLTKEVFAGLASAVTGAFSVIKTAFDDFFENADKLNDMATNVGIAVNQLSSLGKVAEQSGASTEDVAEAFKFLGKNVSEAMDGNKEAVDLFQRLGIEFADSAGNARPLIDVMMEFADALKNIPSAGDRTAASMALIGRSGSGLIAMLSQGSQAISEQQARFDRWGVTVSETAAASADKFGDLKDTIASAWTGIENAIGQPLVEALTPMLEKVVGWLDQHMPAIIRIVGETTQEVGAELAKLGDWIGDHFPQIATFTGAVASGVLEAVRTIGSAFLNIEILIQRVFSGIFSAVSSAAAAAKGIPLIGWMFGDVSSMAKAGSDMANAQRTAMEEVLRSFNQTVSAMQTGISKLSVEAGAVGPGSSSRSGGGGGGGGADNTYNVTVVSPDMDASTGQLATAFQAGLRQAKAGNKEAIDLAFKKAAMQAGGF